jgi:hypothetical protein
MFSGKAFKTFLVFMSTLTVGMGLMWYFRNIFLGTEEEEVRKPVRTEY